MNDAEPKNELNASLFSMEDAGLAALLMLVINMIGGGILTWVDCSDEIRGLANNLTLQAGLFLGVSVILIRKHLSWRDTFGLRAARWPRAAAIGLIGCAVLVPVTFLLQGLSQYFLTKWGLPANDQLAIQWLQDDHDLLFRSLLFAQAVFVAPVCEELFFRGLLLQSLRRHLATPWAIALSAILFAAFHLNLPATLPLFAVAAGFAIAYLYSRSLAAAIVMHAAYNLVNFTWVICLSKP